MCVCTHFERSASKELQCFKNTHCLSLDLRAVPSSALQATTFVSLAASFPFQSTPSRHYSLIFSRLFWLLSASSSFLFLFFGMAPHSIMLSCHVLPLSFLTATHLSLSPHHFSFNSLHCILTGLKE